MCIPSALNLALSVSLCLTAARAAEPAQQQQPAQSRRQGHLTPATRGHAGAGAGARGGACNTCSTGRPARGGAAVGGSATKLRPPALPVPDAATKRTTGSLKSPRAAPATERGGTPRGPVAAATPGNGAFELNLPPQSRVEACIDGERHVRWATTEYGWGAGGPSTVRFGTGSAPAPEHVVVVLPPGAAL